MQSKEKPQPLRQLSARPLAPNSKPRWIVPKRVLRLKVARAHLQRQRLLVL
jgi:hypothetical protein